MTDRILSAYRALGRITRTDKINGTDDLAELDAMAEAWGDTLYKDERETMATRRAEIMRGRK